jgi:hypothetical protein
MDADAKNPARRESTAELLADWRAAERDAVAAREAARIATLALEAARAAEEAALETETAANAASEAVERALQAAGSARRAASQAAEAAKIFTTGVEAPRRQPPRLASRRSNRRASRSCPLRSLTWSLRASRHGRFRTIPSSRPAAMSTARVGEGVRLPTRRADARWECLSPANSGPGRPARLAAAQPICGGIAPPGPEPGSRQSSAPAGGSRTGALGACAVGTRLMMAPGCVRATARASALCPCNGCRPIYQRPARRASESARRDAAGYLSRAVKVRGAALPSRGPSLGGRASFTTHDSDAHDGYPASMRTSVR